MRSASKLGYQKPKCDNCGGELRLEIARERLTHYKITKNGKQGKASIFSDNKGEYLNCPECWISYDVVRDEYGRIYKDGEGESMFIVPNSRIV